MKIIKPKKYDEDETDTEVDDFDDKLMKFPRFKAKYGKNFILKKNNSKNKFVNLTSYISNHSGKNIIDYKRPEMEKKMGDTKKTNLTITEEEKEKNRNLLELGKKYNDVEKTYQLVLQNISSLVEEEKQNPLNVQMDKEGNDEGGNENQFELTSDELKNYDEIEVKREERLDLDKYNLNDEENEIVNNVKKLSDKDINDLESIELIELNNIIRRDEENNNLTEEKRQIIHLILERK